MTTSLKRLSYRKCVWRRQGWPVLCRRRGWICLTGQILSNIICSIYNELQTFKFPIIQSSTYLYVHPLQMCILYTCASSSNVHPVYMCILFRHASHVYVHLPQMCIAYIYASSSNVHHLYMCILFKCASHVYVHPPQMCILLQCASRDCT